MSQYGGGSRKWWIWISVIIVLLALVAPSAADFGPNHMRYKLITVVIERCYFIENADEYPGYVFGVAPWPEQSGGFVSFDDKRCFYVENYTHLSQIYAIQKTDYSRLKKENLSLIPYYMGIPSGYPAPLQSVDTHIDYRPDPDNQTDNLTIVFLNNSSLILHTNRSYQLFNDQVNELPVSEPSFPVIIPPPTPTSTPLPVHVVLASVVLTWGLVVMVRKKKKS
jgi:hypothetical protein